jgi:hypothetical protein
MSNRLVIHIFHDDESSTGTSSHVAERIRQVKDAQNVELEVYVFGPAQKLLSTPAGAAFRETLTGLATAGVPVHTCRNTAESMGTVEALIQMGFVLEYARDAFVRYAVEGATVISF